MHWQSRPQPKNLSKIASKTKYTCPTCGTNAWAKPATRLLCGVCFEAEKGIASVMQSAGA